MNSVVKKSLLGANILLLLIICFAAVKFVNGRATEMALEQLTLVCAEIVGKVGSETMSLEQAQTFATQQTSLGDYEPDVRVFQASEGLILETSDPVVVNELLKGSKSRVAQVNCTQLGQ